MNENPDQGITNWIYDSVEQYLKDYWQEENKKSQNLDDARSPEFINKLEILHNWNPTDQMALKEQLNQIDISEIDCNMTDLETKDISDEIVNIIQTAAISLHQQEKNMNKDLPKADQGQLLAHMVKIKLQAMAYDLERVRGNAHKTSIPDLMYLDIGLGQSDNPQNTLAAQGLMDTGCTNSILDWYTFMQIPEVNVIKQEQLRRETTILSAAGTQTTVMGQANIKLWIWDIHKKIHVPFYHKFLIATGLRETIYLGRDFIYKQVDDEKSRNWLGIDQFIIDE